MVQVPNPVITDLKKRAEELGSQKAAAEAIGISEQHFSDVVNERRNLSEDLLTQLGYTKVIVHVKAAKVPDVVKAIEKAQRQ